MGRTMQDGLLKVGVEEQAERWLVRVSGELDLANVGTLATELEELDGDKPVLFDLAQLEFMDSAALGLFVRTAGNTTDAPRLNVRNASGQVQRLLRLCGLDARESAVLA